MRRLDDVILQVESFWNLAMAMSGQGPQGSFSLGHEYDNQSEPSLKVYFCIWEKNPRFREQNCCLLLYNWLSVREITWMNTDNDFPNLLLCFSPLISRFSHLYLFKNEW